MVDNLDQIAASMIIPAADQKDGARKADGSQNDADLARRKREQREQEYKRAVERRSSEQQPASESDTDEDAAADDDTNGRAAGRDAELGRQNGSQPRIFDEDEDDDGDTSDEDADEDQGDEDDDVLALALGDAHRERDEDDQDTDVIDASKLGDDAKLSVTVDGEDQIVTLGDLKRRYAGEGAIEKRLQAATEARTKAVEDYSRVTATTQQVLQQFGQLMFRRTVPQPDPELLNKNPAAFYKQKELFDQETQSLSQAQQGLFGLVQQVDEAFEQNRREQRAMAAQQLRQIMPVFNDPAKGPKVKAALIEAAKEIGYTDEQIAACEDPLMFKTVALAARELKRMKGVKAEPSKTSSRTMKKTNKGSGASADSTKRRQNEALKVAAKTGRIEDVAASMIVAAPKKQRRY